MAVGGQMDAGRGQQREPSNHSNQFWELSHQTLFCCIPMLGWLPAEIRKPGSAPGNAGGAAPAPVSASLPAPAANGFVPEPAAARQAVQQPSPLPVGQQQTPPEPPVTRAAAAAAAGSRATSRYPSRREASGIPSGPAAAAAAAVPPPAPATHARAAAAPASAPFQPQPERRQPAAPAPVQQQAWEAPSPASAAGDDVLGAIMAAEDDLITSHRCACQGLGRAGRTWPTELAP